MKSLLTALALAATLLASGAAHARDDFYKCGMRAIMKVQSNYGAIAAHSSAVARQLKTEVKAAIVASENDREDKVTDLLDAAVVATEKVTKKPTNAYVLEAAVVNGRLLTMTLQAAVEADEPTMQKTLIDSAIQQIVMAALTPCNM
jgi:hypothetical protein